MSGVLTHSPADIIAQLLVNASQATLPSANDTWPVHVGNEPENPDAAITIFDASPRLNGRLQPTGETQEHHGIQIQVRHPKHAGGWTKINALANYLDVSVRLNTVTISGTTYTVYAVSRASGPFSLGNEAGSKRKVFTLNSLVSVRQN